MPSHNVTMLAPPLSRCPFPAARLQPSTQGLARELAERGEAAGRRVLCPVPHVLPPLVEPEVVPKFLAALTEVRCCHAAITLLARCWHTVACMLVRSSLEKRGKSVKPAVTRLRVRI